MEGPTLKGLTTGLLIVGGLVHAIPQVYSYLSGLTGNVPYIQIIVGIVSIVVGLVHVFKK